MKTLKQNKAAQFPTSAARQNQFLQRASVLSFAALLLGAGAASAQNNHFLPPVKNPFGWNPTYKGVKYPQIVDLENDGLLDFCFLDSTGYAYVKNTGTATNPNFSGQAIRNPFNMPNPERMRALIDLDGDNLLDLIHIDSAYTAPYRKFLTYIPNQGSPTVPSWTAQPVHKFLRSDHYQACVVGLDGDSDGLSEVIVCDYGSYLAKYFKNDSMVTTPPNGLNDTQTHGAEATASFAFADMDNDGDVDAWRISGVYYLANNWKIDYAENLNVNNEASFGAYSVYPMNLSSTFADGTSVLLDSTYFLYPSILTADMNDDGDIDLFVTSAMDTNLVMYENTKCDTNNTAPIISQSLNTISTATGATAYQWFSVNSQGIRTPMQGATNATFTPAASGNYTVRAKKTNGCVAYAANFAFTVIGVETVADARLWNIMPNPATSEIFVQSDLSWLRWEIIDAQGRVIRTIAKPTTNSINISELPQGMYTLRGQSADGKSAISRFVKK